jgi:hypothetical protein
MNNFAKLAFTLGAICLIRRLMAFTRTVRAGHPYPMW